MRNRPSYFETIRRKAEERWIQLEQDPDLAGPWHQLFKQVQSPRHVVSELLQNADDAGATEAVVRIEDRKFIFEHNGEDFTKDHFASLCRFGYSNKRALHTIGFRGIGFKSIFSLGDLVELFTPTLSVRFDRKRFTQPHWVEPSKAATGLTRIMVAVSDKNRMAEVQKNLEEWAKSPISLLFFRNIRRLTIGEYSLHWEHADSGPIPNSHWVYMVGQEDTKYLLVRSAEEEFPDDALEEIKQERMVGVQEETDFPPCRIEIVLGGSGRLFVVLPTGVETDLPFACNAPFVQDPARLKIKDPETSPTNRWLLERAGKLAAGSMIRWLNLTNAAIEERAKAYKFFPEAEIDEDSLEDVVSSIVKRSFLSTIREEPFLLTDDGDLVNMGGSLIFPDEICEIWTKQELKVIFWPQWRPPFCLAVDKADRSRLEDWGVVESIEKKWVISKLSAGDIPQPKSWGKLLNLWSYVAPEISRTASSDPAREVQILPVHGKRILQSKKRIVRLGERKLLPSEEDWDFLSNHLLVLNQNWTRFLTEQERIGQGNCDEELLEKVESAQSLFRKLGLHEPTDSKSVLDQVAGRIFSNADCEMAESVKLAQIAAKLDVPVGESFQYWTRDGQRRRTAETLLFDIDGRLEGLLPPGESDARLIHPSYSKTFTSCTKEEWYVWMRSGKAGVETFPPLVRTRINPWNEEKLKAELRKRGSEGEVKVSYRSPSFRIEDWDFSPPYWRYWNEVTEEDPNLWVTLVDLMLKEKDVFWTKHSHIEVFEIANNGYERRIRLDPVTASWVTQFRNLPCLHDTRGFNRIPCELFRRTPETEPLMDLESFVEATIDNEANRPLLDLLGVQSKPTGPGLLLERLRALSKSDRPPAYEVEKWYRRLDQMVETCSTSDFQAIRDTFHDEKLILTEDGVWATSSAVFLASDEEDVPDASVIHSSVADFMLWRKIGVADRPTAELAMEWLKDLPVGESLPPEDVRRVRSLLVRFPRRIWDECGCWLNLAGEWAAVDSMAYSITMQSLTQWKHLYSWVKEKTADLQRVPGEVTNNAPFNHLVPLVHVIEERLGENPVLVGNVETKEWLAAFGQEMERVNLEDNEETERVRILASDLSRTKWQVSSDVEITPYIDGTPAGTPLKADVLWVDRVLYVGKIPMSRLAKRVPEEIAKAFNREDIKAALCFAFERGAKEVREYLQENFVILPVVESAPVVDEEVDVPKEEPVIALVDQLGSGERADVLPGEEPKDVSDSDLEQILQPSICDPMVETWEDAATDSAEDASLPIRKAPRLARPSFLERFAASLGFSLNGEGRFFHPDGRWMERFSESPFPWQLYSPSGLLLRSYWVNEHCLEREPLEIRAEVWSLLKNSPEGYALILCDPFGEPFEISGSRIVGLTEEGEVTLFPASYRLVYNPERETS